MTAENPSQTRKAPFPVRNIPFFYGWVILGITFSSNMITSGINGYGISFFVVPMSDALGVTRAEFSAISLFRLAAIPVIPFIGMMLDRQQGPRAVVTIASILAGLALIATAFVEEMWQFYLVFGIIFGVVATTMNWQLLGATVLAKWFIRMRGRAFAISTIGISLGGFVIAPIAGLLIDAIGWRGAWAVLGIGMLITLAPAALIFMRRQPSDVGLLPDGRIVDAARDDSVESEPQRDATSAEPYEYPWTVREAVRTPGFWAVLAAQALGQAGLFGVLFHQVAYMQDKGLSVAEATLATTTLAGAALVSKLFYGFLAERFGARLALAAAMIPTGLCLLLLVVGGGLEMVLVYAVLYGFTMGGFIPMINVAFAQYFGRQNMGAIRGAAAPPANVAGAASPFVIGLTWQWLGNYDVSFMMLCAIWAVGGLIILMAAQPRTPTHAAERL
ncbi:MAG: MFS transporter [Dehalococcoidia bacterium]|nr:MFS transporter [Dehalococcoidia bacterium]